LCPRCYRLTDMDYMNLITDDHYDSLR
jgi:hypothetical protein